MIKYTFDVQLDATVYVTAASEDEARALMRHRLDFDSLLSTDDLELGVTTLHETPELIDAEPLPAAPFLRHCNTASTNFFHAPHDDQRRAQVDAAAACAVFLEQLERPRRDYQPWDGKVWRAPSTGRVREFYDLRAIRRQHYRNADAAAERAYQRLLAQPPGRTEDQLRAATADCENCVSAKQVAEHYYNEGATPRT